VKNGLKILAALATQGSNEETKGEFITHCKLRPRLSSGRDNPGEPASAERERNRMKAGSKYTWLVAVATAALCASARAGILTNLQVQAVPFSATEGIPFYNARVATFTDPGEIFPSYLTGPVYEVTNYSATITWGDGSGPYPATLVPGFPGIDVIGTHTYTEHGG
jgi:hypothetical protein